MALTLRNYRVDFSKVRSVLDFEPKYTIKNGIDELVIALKNHIFEFVESDKLLLGITKSITREIYECLHTTFSTYI